MPLSERAQMLQLSKSKTTTASQKSNPNEGRRVLKSAVSLQELNICFEPKIIQVILKDYMERSLNYLNPQKIRERNLVRVAELTKTLLLKQILSLLFWQFVVYLQIYKRRLPDGYKEATIEKNRQFEKLLQEKYFQLLARLHQPKDLPLEIIPLLLAQSVIIILKEKMSDNLEEIYGMYGHAQECQLFVYQFVLMKFNQGIELPLSSVDKLRNKYMNFNRKIRGASCRGSVVWVRVT